MLNDKIIISNSNHPLPDSCDLFMYSVGNMLLLLRLLLLLWVLLLGMQLLLLVAARLSPEYIVSKRRIPLFRTLL